MIFKNLMKITNPKELLIKDQLTFLQELVKASLINFPFQNISTFGAFLPCDRHVPSNQKFISANIKGEGGLCGPLNNHVKFQLETFGFQVDKFLGCFRRTGVPMSHSVIKVKIPGNAVKDPTRKSMDPRPDKEYLVDVGSGVPLHEPIDLDKLPYFGTAAGLQYRYEWVDDHTIQRVNECGDAILGKKPSTFISPQNYYIELVPRSETDFRSALQAIYRNPRSVFIHQGIYSFRYLEITDDDFQIVCIRGTDLMFITKETRHVQSFSSYEELKPSLLKYFPMISPQEIELSVKHFSMPFEEALKMSSVMTKGSGCL